MLHAAREERSASELAAAAGLSPSAASPHLRQLREAGLLRMRVDAKRRLYQVDFVRLGEVRAALDELWADRLDLLKDRAERSDDGRRSGRRQGA
jgi:DNA-binding transcriptional ArsR family regulator